uniref:NADH dehydrogenase subunit 6 n=1 Tax=Tylorrhynchus heterochetus TaxID=3228785 RepID=A0A097KZL0_TYLHE|nr:NADH dehydrogenase subunit 6 [Tylorrhynchus heterochaetus]AIT99404.2 NADH dehydrogenase subunit 6 [Tylorrhynchus heterochaetus]
MLLTMTSSLMTTIVISILIAISPLTLGIMILTTALLAAMMINFFLTSWFSFITFIIYVGGMLVMFAYFAALQPNYHITNIGLGLVPILFSLTAIIFSINWPIMVSIKSTPTYVMILFPHNVILISLALLLFLALIAVVKTSHAAVGPLRPFD